MKYDTNKEIQDFVGASIVSFSNNGTDLIIGLSSGAQIETSYWRVLPKIGMRVSNFDHQQKYGLHEAINAADKVKDLILNQKIRSIEFIARSGDIEVNFENDSILEIFNFSGYEVWEIRFDDGSSIYSNYA